MGNWGDFVYPLLVGFGLFAVVLVIGTVFAYFFLVWWSKELTKCPECGKRGAGALVESTEIGSRVYTEWRNERDWTSFKPTRRQLYQVTEETRRDRLKCESCGHQWTRTAKQSQSEKLPTK
jgi:hypothetical protein